MTNEEQPVIHINDQRALRINNQLAILNVLRNQGPLSRKRLQDETGLSWGTITYLTGELLKMEIIREMGMVATHVGRPPVNLDLNAESNYAVGIWMGNTRVDATLLDVKGQRVLDRSLPLDPSAEAAEIVERMFDSIDILMRDASVSPARIAGIGCAVPGSYSPETGICAYAPNHPKWRDVPLLNRIIDRYGRPVFIDHDMNCCVLGEYLFGAARRFSTFVCVNIEGGIGAGIMIDGRIYRGVDNSAGELGHIRVEPDGPRCSCGRVGCLESLASVSALLARARDLPGRMNRGVSSKAAGGVGEYDTIEALIRSAQQGDKDILTLFEEAGRYLGVGIGMLVTLFNPETVIMSGSLCGARDYLGPSMDASAKENAWPYSRIDVRFTALDNGIVRGAAGMVLQEIFSNALLLRAETNTGRAALGQ